jgi:tetratricopeptide (TPR) repeat protein
VQITTPSLPHLAFYEALAVLEESNAAWSETVAGLLTLRLFDSWGEMHRRGERVQAWEVSGVAEAVDELPESHPARAPLRAVIDAVRAPHVAPASALVHLSSYARTLRFEAKWLLAADVFATMLSNARGASDEVVIGAAYHRGYCLRMAGQLDAAAASYDEGRALAASCGNEAGLLEADVSHAALALHRGNLPAAESLLDEVIERAGGIACTQVLAHALHERAHVAARRGRFDDAVVFAYRALPLFASAGDRDRVLGDIAGAMGDAGHHAAAWDAHLLLSATAQAQETRWVAVVNLIELAALRGHEALFERFRAGLAGLPLPAYLLGHYHLFSGIGYQRFGRTELAERALHEAIDVAARFELNEVRLRAETALTAKRAAAPSTGALTAEPTAAVAEVMSALRTMRELAGVGTE